MANNGQISIVKMSTGAYGYSASNYHIRIFNKGPKDPKNPLRLDLTTIEGVAAIFQFLLQEGLGGLWSPSLLLLQRSGGL